MRSGRAFFSDPDFSQRQVKVIATDQDLVRTCFEFSRQFYDRLARSVHEGVEFDKGRTVTGPIELAALVPVAFIFAGKMVDQPAAEIVAGPCVFFSRIPKTDNELDLGIFFQNGSLLS